MQDRPLRPRAEQLFLLSSYFALSMACACLVWSEIGILNEILFFAVMVGALIVVSYFMEGRWSLSVRNANRVGVVIGLFAVASVGRQMIYPPTKGPLTQMPWPTSMVPLLGPLLLLLLSVKLLRPKSIGDHWWLQVIGLVCVSLGCTMADDGVFAVLMAIYLVLSLWCLALFFLYRERLTHPGSRAQDPPRWRQIASWSVPILLIGAVGFLTLPRSQAVWRVPQNLNPIETGIPDDPGLDLHKTGTLTLNTDVAFEVYAEDHYFRPKLDLSPNQRWRGPVYRIYQNGNWLLTPKASNRDGRFGNYDEAPSGAFINFHRPDRYFLNFTIRDRIGAIPFISDPIYFEKDEIPVVTVLPGRQYRRWFAANESMLEPERRPRLTEGDKYRQVAAPPPEPDLHEVHPKFDRRAVIESPGLPRLTEWTSDLLQTLVKNGRIPDATVRQRDSNGEVPPVHYESIAKALCEYLSSSGEYKYTLDLDTRDPDIDPTLDFLLNTKSGHCNRFASALALMLRTMHIPCQVVTGYRGADSLGDGNYVVRQCYAHTWVEVYVPRRSPPSSPVGSAGPQKWYWLTLDPTPSDAETTAAANNRWWDTGLSLRRIYRNLIVNFSYGNRDDFFRDLSTASTAIWGGIKYEIRTGTMLGYVFLVFFVGVSAAVGLLLARIGRIIGRRWRNWRMRARLATQTEFYQRMLAILSKRGWRRSPFQTSREFADAISQRMRSRNFEEGLADVVRRTMALFDRVRFGNRPLDAEESVSVRSDLDRLARSLAKR